MATIQTELLRGDANNGAGVLTTLLGKARAFFSGQTDQRATLAERINQADADYYDRFYG